jgi:hypothetical protein
LERELLVAGLRAGVASGVFGEGTPASLIEGLLAAAEIGRVPHTVCLLDFRAMREPDGTGMVVQELGAVIELRTRRDHAEYLRTVRAILQASERNAGQSGEQRRLELPGDRVGVAFRIDTWDAWREIAWASLDDRFVVGVGRGALADWFAGARGGDEAAWLRHRTRVEAERPAGDVFVEGFIDLRGLRRRFPSAFQYGRTPRMLRSLDMANDAEVMLHGRFVELEDGPPLLALDVTSSAGEQVQRNPLSAARWPGEIGMEPPPGSYAIVTRVDWPATYTRIVSMYESTVPEPELDAFRASRDAWEARNAADLKVLWSRLQPWVVLSDVPPPVLPAPGLSTVFVPVRAGAADMEQTISALLTDFADRVTVQGSPGTRMWQLKIDERGVVRLPAWGMATGDDGVILIGGWGAPVVMHNRERLGGDP